jgi:uncharacterized membrane protein
VFELLTMLLIVGGVLLFNRLRQAEAQIRNLEGEVEALDRRTRRQVQPEPVTRAWHEATAEASVPVSPWAGIPEQEEMVEVAADGAAGFPDANHAFDPGPGIERVQTTGASAEAPEPPAPARRWRLEELFGARLPVWGGGVAIAFAGIFLVRYAIDLGLLTPLVRVGLGVAAGALLLALAEASRTLAVTRSDPRIAQAFAGAAIVTLYAVTYLATRSYGLIPAAAGIAGMGAVTAVALFMAWRHGPPTAILGLVGGFMAPAVMATDEGSVPLLLLYLAAAIAGMVTLGRLKSWPWLSALGLAGGLLWAVAILAGGQSAGDLRALALFLLAVAVATMLVRPDVNLPERLQRAIGPDDQPLASLVLAAVASLLLVSATVEAGLAPADWLLQGALGIAAVAVAGRDPRLLPIPMLGLLLSIWAVSAIQPSSVSADRMRVQMPLRLHRFQRL